VTYRVNLEPSALRQIGGLPGDVFDMLVNRRNPSRSSRRSL
jgi:hypothetical protein